MARSLVDVLSHAKITSLDTNPPYLCIQIEGDDFLELVSKYEARRLALERAFADAKAAQGRHGLVTAWRFLEEALAAVPEIPEEP